MEWTVKFHRWRDSTAKTVSVAGFNALTQGAPLLVKQVLWLDYIWYRPAIRELPQARWIAEATLSAAKDLLLPHQGHQ